MLLSPSSLRRRVYLAYLDGVAGPVGIATLVHMPSRPVAVLFNAATLKACRGQGVYHSLVKRRLADASQEGARAAIIQAVRETSAPICRKLGFVELAALDWYAWLAEG